MIKSLEKVESELENIKGKYGKIPKPNIFSDLQNVIDEECSTHFIHPNLMSGNQNDKQRLEEDLQSRVCYINF